MTETPRGEPPVGRGAFSRFLESAARYTAQKAAQPPPPTAPAPAEPVIDIWGEAGEPAPQSPPVPAEELVGDLELRESPALFGAESPLTRQQTLKDYSAQTIIEVEYNPGQGVIPTGLGKFAGQPADFERDFPSFPGQWVIEPARGQRLVLRINTERLNADSFSISAERATLLTVNNLFNGDAHARPLKLYGYGVDERGFPYLLTERPEEFVQLQDYINKQSQTPREVLQIGIGVCEIVNKLHEAGIIYRGLRMDGIFWDPQTRNVRLGNWKNAYLDWEDTLSSVPKEDVEGLIALANYAGDRSAVAKLLVDMTQRLDYSQRSSFQQFIAPIIERFSIVGESNQPLSKETSQELLDTLKDSLHILEEKAEAEQRRFNTLRKEKIPGVALSKDLGSEITPLEFMGRDGRKVIADRFLSPIGVYSNVYAARHDGEDDYTLAVKVGKLLKQEEIDRAAGRPGIIIDAVKVSGVFWDEAKVLRALTARGSKHTPRLHYFHPGTDLNSDPPYIVMDLAKGNNLNRLPEHYRYWLRGEIMGEGLEESAALEIACQIAEVFDVSFQAGYYNGDLKDWNPTEPKELSFGGYIWDDDGRNLTAIDWNTVDRAVDSHQRNYVLRLGKILYHFLIGQAPDSKLPLEDQKEWDLLRQIASEETQQILRRLITPQADQRYNSLSELRADLERQRALLQPAGVK